MLELVIVFVSVFGVPAFEDSSRLLGEMTDEGVLVLEGQRCLLPEPSLRGELDSDSRQAVLDDLAGGRGWKHFSRASISAPVAIRVQYVKNAKGERIGHQVHCAFVVHAPLETLKDRELMEQLFLPTPSSEGDRNDADEQVSASAIGEEELKAAGIASVADDESYGLVELPLLKKVVVRGVMRSERQVDGNSVTLAWLIDPRFTGDPSGKNVWAKVNEDESGEMVLGETHPYRGAGGYMHISRLAELPDACLVEMRFVLHEPTDWFRGSAMLRSKLPLLLQDSAKKFRRKVMNK
ncbi:MAG: hypothetical protein AAGG48_22555 [Planctomycetota bacterium]